MVAEGRFAVVRADSPSQDRPVGGGHAERLGPADYCRSGRLPPLRFVALQGVVCRVVRGTLGFPRCEALTVSSEPLAFPGRPSPATLVTGSFPRASRSSSEFLRLPTGPPLAVRLRPAGGLFPLRGVTRWRPLSRRIPSLRYVPSSGFLNLSTVSSATRLCGLVSSHSHVQGFRSGVYSRSAAAPTRRRPCPLVLIGVSLTGCPAATTRRPDFEALIRGAIRTSLVGG